MGAHPDVITVPGNPDERKHIVNETMELARFAAELDYDKLPREVQVQGLRLFIDFVGNSCYATKTPAAKIIADYALAASKPGVATVLPRFEGRAEASFAALAMGQLGHGFELDDVHMASVQHPSGPVCGAALAMAQERGVTGKRLIEAVIVGYEVSIRSGLPLGSAHQDWGFHATASFTTFGATAAAAKVLGLDAPHIASALGLAGSLASGTKKFAKSKTPSMVESLHGGKAAQQGVECAMLSERGFTGPADVLEGKWNYLEVVRGFKKAEDIDYSIITEGLGTKFHCMDISIKPNCNCATTFTAIQCLQDFKRDPDFKVEDIEKVVIQSHHNILQSHMDYAPISVSAAQYSTPFSIAFNLLHDVDDPAPFLNPKLNEDPEVLALAQKVTAELDPEIDALFPAHFGNKVHIEMKDGRTYDGKYIDYAGSAENPYTYEQIVAKARNLITLVYGAETANQLVENLERTPELFNVNELFAGLR